MAPHISENLSRIKKAAPQLNTLADEATKQIRAIDDMLSSLGVGVEVEGKWFKGGTTMNTRGHRTSASYTLTYGRDDEGKFGLVVHEEAQATDEDGEIEKEDDHYGNSDVVWQVVNVTRLAKCSRALRISALGVLSEVIEQIANALESTVKSVQDKMEEAKAVTAELSAAVESHDGKFHVDMDRLRDLMDSNNKTVGYINRFSGTIIAADEINGDPLSWLTNKFGAYVEIPKFMTVSVTVSGGKAGKGKRDDAPEMQDHIKKFLSEVRRNLVS